MTDDVDLVRLTAHVEAAGAKMVLLGDHRQLGPVGPGRCPGGAGRPPPRRRPLPGREPPPGRPRRAPGARGAAGGEVDKAVAWYVEGRAACTPSRAGTRPCSAAVDAWAADVDGGPRHGPVRLAAGQRGRAEPAGPALDGRKRPAQRPRAGDCPAAQATGPATMCVALAPSRTERSSPRKRATVEAVDLSRGTLALRTRRRPAHQPERR